MRPLAPGDVSLDLLSHAVGQRLRVPMLVQQLRLAASESIFRTFSELISNWNACEGIEECKVVPVVCTTPTATAAGIAAREESTGSRGFKPATPRVARRTGDVAVTGMPSPTRLRDRSRSGRIGWLDRRGFFACQRGRRAQECGRRTRDRAGWQRICWGKPLAGTSAMANARIPEDMGR